MSLYSDMMAAGLVTGSHESDLYVRDTPAARAIIRRHGWGTVKRFRDARDGTPSLDVGFAFEPFWERVARRGGRP